MPDDDDDEGGRGDGFSPEISASKSPICEYKFLS